MLRHFGAIAEATTLPVIVYNIPGRTGANMLPATLHELARRYPNIAGVKESSGDIEQFSAILRDRARRVSRSVGRRLLLSAVAGGRRRRPDQRRRAPVRPRSARDDRGVRRGATSRRAARIHRELSPLFAALFAHDEPDPGEVGDERDTASAPASCRPPLGEMPEASRRRCARSIAPYRPRRLDAARPNLAIDRHSRLPRRRARRRSGARAHRRARARLRRPRWSSRSAPRW